MGKASQIQIPPPPNESSPDSIQTVYHLLRLGKCWIDPLPKRICTEVIVLSVLSQMLVPRA